MGGEVSPAVRDDRAGSTTAGRGREPPLGGRGFRRPALAPRAREDLRRKTGKARFVYLPEWLLQAIDGTCPLEDRTPDRKVFQGITEASAYQAMLRACRSAVTGHFHPHDLRHRRITLWHQSGVPARELAERVGHSKPSMSLDVYSHVMPADEVSDKRLLALIEP
jgi:integrase